MASSRARSRSRAASTAASGSGTSTMLWVASMRAMNSASRRSFLRRASAAGLCILETAATAQSRPSARSSRAMWKPVGPLS